MKRKFSNILEVSKNGDETMKTLQPSLQRALRKIGFKKVKSTGFLGMKGGEYGPLTVTDVYLRHNKEVAFEVKTGLIQELKLTTDMEFNFNEKSQYEFTLSLTRKTVSETFGFYFCPVTEKGYQNYYLTFINLS